MRSLLILGAALALLLVSSRAEAVSVAAVSAEGAHTCALTSGGGVKCWGYNYVGQLGDGTTTGGAVAVDVSTLGSGITAIEAGTVHTCALTGGGGVKCWGQNDEGQLGVGTAIGPEMCSGSPCSKTPVDVCATGATPPCTAVNGNLLTGVTAVAAGRAHTCALTSGGGVKCWGSGLWGALGDGTATQRLTPVDVSGLGSGVAAISAGIFDTCALTSGGGVKCWGDNVYGQLGVGTNIGPEFCNPSRSCSKTPIDVLDLGSGIAAVSAGSWHTCALVSGGGVKCWGTNWYGELGNGTTTGPETCGGFGGQGCSTAPVDVLGLVSGSVAAVSAGWHHTCALTFGGGVKCWGDNYYSQMGDGDWAMTPRTMPVDVCATGAAPPCTTANGNNLTSVASISAGPYYICAVTNAGGVKCWGSNGSFQLGDETTVQRMTPVDVSFDGDADGDGVTYPTDNCPTVANSGQANQDGDAMGDDCDGCPTFVPPWSSPPGDADCDGFMPTVEATIGTNLNSWCGFTAGAPNESENWPADLVESNNINIQDVLALKPWFGTAVPPTSARYEIVPSGNVNISDVLALKPFFGASCTP